ncbi:MAG: hypothetical protein JWP57_4181 [Spirosoma sp.]|nr:hypothetical protein [Spirosoma sp.]
MGRSGGYLAFSARGFTSFITSFLRLEIRLIAEPFHNANTNVSYLREGLWVLPLGICLRLEALF